MGKKLERIIGICFIGVVLVAALSILIPIFKENNRYKNIDVKLNGDLMTYLSVNNDYHDDGFSIYDNDKKIDSELYSYKITNNVNTHIPGTYDIDYEIKYLDNIYYLTRSVSVVDDIKPDINVTKEKVSMYKCGKKTVSDLEYSAVDNYDGVITDKVREVIDGDKLTLSVSDSAGNNTIKELSVSVTENVVPVITLNGSNIIYVAKGKKYTDEGAKVSDLCGNKTSKDLMIENNVDTSKTGTYKVIYKIDNDGEIIKKVRTVHVYTKSSTSTTTDSGAGKVVYLTFDDGPGRYTKKILDILDKYDVKATFFVTNQFKSYVPLIKDINNRGHVVAVHTLTHKWSIYSSVENYMKDFNDMNEIIKKYTGSYSNIFRFPGGSSNTISKGYSKGVVSAIASKMKERGYVYFDWNVDSCDASGANKSKVVSNVISGMKRKSVSVVLMHDIKKATADGIEEIVKYGVEHGYTFKTLNVNSPTVQHSIRN